MSKQNATRISIEVTESDIERAHRSDSYKCVVAQAVARTVTDATRIEVDTQTIRFTRGTGERWLYLTPYAVQGYVIAFDAGDDIEPFTFQLRDPKRIARKRVTEAGRAVQRETKKARRAQTGPTPVKQVTTPTEEGSVVTSTSADLEAVKAAYAGAKKTESDGGGRKAPPRVFKQKKRMYGHRLLRINQD